MSNISTLLQQILTAVYGREVRQSIHDAIQQCYSDMHEQVSNAVNEWLDNNPDATTTVTDGSITESKLDASLKQKIESGGINVVYPLQRSSYYDKLTTQMQNKADSAIVVSTEKHLAHAIRGCAGNRILCLLFGENNVENDKSTDTSDTSGKWHMKCKLYLSEALAGGVFGWTNNYASTDTFDIFPAGATVYDMNGKSLGTIVSSSDGVATRSYGKAEDAEGFFHIHALCVLNNGNKVAVHRTLMATYTTDGSGGSISYTLPSNITTLTLTVNGIKGENNLSRVNSNFSGPAFSGCGYQYNSTNNKYYLATVINNYGVVILSTSDFIDHAYEGFYAYEKAYIECSLYFDTKYLDQTHKSGMYLACRSVYGHEFIRLAKLDYSNNYAVMDEVDLPATTSMPCFSSSYNNNTTDNCYLAVSDYNRNRASIYQIMQKNIRQLKPIAVIENKCCNYITIITTGRTPLNRATGDFIVCGTNGDAENLKGVSWFYENLSYGHSKFTG